MNKPSRLALYSLLVLGGVWACPFDDTLRAYLDVRFWLPFSKQAWHFEHANVKRANAPFAGMAKATGATPLARLRSQYQQIAQPINEGYDPEPFREMVAAARADKSLRARDREEVDLIDAKIDMRLGQPGTSSLLPGARKKFEEFLKTARTPEFLSEARGWLAHIDYVLGDQTAAGKIYLDELNRNGSNLSRETLLTSLHMTYRYDGGPELLAHLDEYFDTPEHAAFAIQLATNPHWNRSPRNDMALQAYPRIKALLQQHEALLQKNTGTNELALLAMRTALRMGDPPSAASIAETVPAGAAIREEPDYLWMIGSAYFLSHEYAKAEAPLLRLFRSPDASQTERTAAAYALCGVYAQQKNVMEQLRFALWLRTAAEKPDAYRDVPSTTADQSLYLAASGWDLNLLLEAQASIETLEAFIVQNPKVADLRIVQYSLAVRLARENRYDESALLYESIHAVRRAPRMRQLAILYRETQRDDLANPAKQQARYKLAEFLVENSNRVYFNDALWNGLQRYALTATKESRLTRVGRDALIEEERKLKDDQEERWRAYLMLREVVNQMGKTELGRRAAALAVRSLRGISERFDRTEEIRAADIELSRWLRESGPVLNSR